MDNTVIFEYAKKLGLNHDNLTTKGKYEDLRKQVEVDIDYIKKVYEMLNKCSELEISIHPAGNWILDNLYVIQKEGMSVINNMQNVEYMELPKINNNLRMYVLAMELVKYTDGNINTSNIREMLVGYSSAKYISLQELWIFPLMIKIALIKYIRQLSEKIYNVQVQRYKVEEIIERLVNQIPNNEKKYTIKFKKEEGIDLNMPFIEYMAYRLSKLDENGLKYIDAFDEQILKLGITVDEVVSREHFDIVTKQISMSNSIISLKDINNINFSKEFETVSEIDVILSQEKANIYQNMNFETLEMYRKEIYNLSKKTGISQKYICTKIIELCNQNHTNNENEVNDDNIKSHSGYYLFGNGIYELLEKLKYSKQYIDKKKRSDKNEKLNSLGIYISCIFGTSIFVTLAISYNIYFKVNNILIYLLAVLVLMIPVSQLVITLLNKLILKCVKPKKLPCMDFEKNVPENCKTFVIIPTLLTSTKRVKELIDSLEMYYLTNKQDNIFFALLGDTTEIDTKHIELDDEIIETGNREIESLNIKYNFEIPKFYFIYRDRVYNEKQGKYLGWERKRGLIKQFNRYLIYGENGQFNTNNIDKEKIGDIKYVLTIDADTQVGINTISSLIGIMAHPLNKPVLNNDKTAVIKGYGILQPRISTHIECATKSKFAEIYAGYGGIDMYTNAVSDIYQDIWNEGIFTGKGIYGLKVFSDILDNQIPENTVLSHDLLEGSYLRCGLVTNVEFIDGYPSRYNSYIVRQNRWLRGDIQICRWICDKIKNASGRVKEINPLNKLSRWKIIDNLRRGLLDISIFVFLVLGLSIFNIKWYIVLGFILLIELLPSILDKVFNINSIFVQKNNYIKMMGGFERAIYMAILDILFLPYKAMTNIDTFIRTIYRMKISKKYLLEWMTAEQAEKTLGKDLKTYIGQMYISTLIGIILIFMTYLYSSYTANIYFAFILSICFTISPVIAWYISKENTEKQVLDNKEKQFLYNVAKDTWEYFNTYISEENNYLIPDNYQENRKDYVVDRTSSTNIGLSFTAIITAYDLGIIDKQSAKLKIVNILNTIDMLEKYKGNLYNWYNIKTLQPLNYNISSVDNGNYIAYLYVLKTFCGSELNDTILANRVQQNIDNLDFSILYDYNKQLFSIEYNAKTNELSKSYYDLLASESRILSYVAIAKGDIPYKNWYSLSRNLTKKNGYKGLLSWTGTSFEYFMPYGLINLYKYSLLDETYKFVTVNQMKYVEKKKIPWGISESAFNLYDTEYNYQYKAMGIPGLGLKRGLKKDLVISPYSSIMILPKYPKKVLKNMYDLIKIGAYGKFGYYESIDYTKQRLENGKKSIVKTFMAHHQGLILIAINNMLNNNIIQKRFFENLEIKSYDILLQEKTIQNNIITNKLNSGIYEEKIVKDIDYDIYENIIDNQNNKNDIQYNVVSNKNYLKVINSKGQGYSKFNNIYINRYDKNDKIGGLKIIIKNRKTDEIIDCMDNALVTFTGYNNKFEKDVNGISIEVDNSLIQENLGEITSLKIRNNTDSEQIFDVFFYVEPILTDINSYISHRAYSNMFLKFEQIQDSIVIHRRKKQLQEPNIFICNKIICQSEGSKNQTDNNNQNIGKTEFELDRYKFIGRNKDIFSSNAIKKDIPFSNEITPTIEPIIAYKTSVKLNKMDSAKCVYIQGIADNIDTIKNIINSFNSIEDVNRNLNLAYNKSIIENRFYKYNSSDIKVYQNIIKYIISNNRYITYEDNIDLRQENLWQFGISGDNHILSITINRKIEAIFIKEMLEAYKYIVNKGIVCDLIIIVNSCDSYIKEIIDEINMYITILSIGYMINNGIYILNKNDVKDNVLMLINILSAISFNTKNGSIENQLNILNRQLEDSIDVNNKQVYGKNTYGDISIDTNNLLYYNEIGGFSNNGKEYKIILQNGYTTPVQWSNVLANKEFGTITNENGGGFTWSNNSSQNKITKWENDQVIDKPSEYVQVKLNDKVWLTTYSGESVDNGKYISTYGKGYTVYESNINDVYINQTVFVPLNDKVKVCVCDIKNNSNSEINLDISYNANILLGNEVEKKIYYVEKNNDENCIIIKNKYNNYNSQQAVYLTSFCECVEETVDNYEDNMDNPEYPYVRTSVKVCLGKLEQKKVVFLLGEDTNPQKMKEVINRYKNIQNVQIEKEKVEKYWDNLLGTIRIKTPIESMNILMNEWLLYQTISSRINARSGYYQVSGAYGFRDQLQDMLSVMYVDENAARQQIIYHASHQYIEGDVMHWWHDAQNNGIRSRYCDDLLWLAYITFEYIKITGDIDILDEDIPYIQSNLLQENEKERYEVPQISDISESLYFHIIRAIDKSINFEKNNLPSIGSGDWSDGLNNVYGQSVWLGFFIYDILKKVLPFVHKKDINKYEVYKQKIEQLENGLENSWDGKWYKRAFYKDGSVIGSNEQDECKIDSIAQSWAVISNVNNQNYKQVAMESVDNLLVDRDNKLIKLFTPSFDKTLFEPGYIKAYMPGIRENGGQYTHAAIWNMMANAILGNGNLAEEYFRILNPIEHARTNEACRKYKVEPYVISADIYSASKLEGRGGWSWYTGAASWMYKVGLEYILGFKKKGNILEIKPCINKEWGKYEIWYKYIDTNYHISVENKDKQQTGVKNMYLDNEKVEKIELKNDNINHEILVIM